MNQPDRYTQFVLPEGETKVAYKADTKLEHAGTFTFRSEDHTIGNLLRMQLHRDKAVVFAGYRIPHPLEAKMVVKIQTNGSKSVEDTMQHALTDVGGEFEDLAKQFESEVEVQVKDHNYTSFKDDSFLGQQNMQGVNMGQHDTGGYDMGGYAPQPYY